MKTSKFARILFFITLFLGNTHPLWAQQVEEGTAINAEAPAPADGEAMDVSGVSNATVQPDYFTGAAVYRLPFIFPPGRQGMTPTLALVYNSHKHQQDGPIGLGWELTTSYIGRMHKYGLPEYDASDFVYHEEGSDYQLIPMGVVVNACSLYRFKREGVDPKRFYKCEGHWQVYDKEGRRHFFGLGGDQLQSGGSAYQWYLSKTEDLNGNRIRYGYEHENWRYDQYDTVNLRLNVIDYTDHIADEQSPFHVALIYRNRPQNTFHYRAGIGIFYGSLLSEIRISLQGGEKVGVYRLEYLEDQKAPLLQRLTYVAGDENNAAREYALQTPPPVSFDYGRTQAGNFWRSRWQNFRDPFDRAMQLDNEYHLLDMNGDGLLDRVWTGRPQNELRNDILVHYNTGSSFNPNAESWDDICRGYCFPSHLHFADMNGDGLPDRILANQGMIYIRYNSGSGNFPWGDDIPDPFCGAQSPHPAACDQFQVQDMNGDGLPDRVDYDPSRLETYIYLNQGHRFSTEPEAWQIQGRGLNNQLKKMMDMNGDKLPDIVVPSSAFPNGGGGSLAIYWNHGHGWFSQPSWWRDPGVDIETDHPALSWLIDVNKDGLPDRLIGRTANELDKIHIYFNTGTGFEQNAANVPDLVPAPFRGLLRYEDGDHLVPGIFDLNGDGYPERVAFDNNGYVVYSTSFGIPNRPYDRPPRLLSKINNGRGVNYNLAYRSTTKMQNRLMPFHLYCLSNIQLQEGPETKNTYIDYAGGQFFSDWYNVVGRKFNGFQFVRIRDPLNGVEERWYHQAYDVIQGNLFVVQEHAPPLGDGSAIPVTPAQSEYDNNAVGYWADVDKSGQVAKKVLYVKKPGQNVLEKYSRLENTWVRAGRFVKLIRSKVDIFEGMQNSEGRTLSYTYNDDSGNITRIIEDVTLGDPERKITDYDYREYPSLFGLLPSSKPAAIMNRSGDLGLKNRIAFEYDDLLNLTSQSESVYYNNVNQFTRTTRFEEYDQYGNPGEVHAPNRVQTVFEYDNSMHTYPVREEVDGNFVTLREYDLRFGKIKSEATPDRRLKVNRYDALGRVFETSFQNQWKEKYEYLDNIARGDGQRLLSAVHKYTYIENDPEADRLPREVTYQDGQGRIVQRAGRSERSNNSYRLQRIRYIQDNSRNTVQESDPFFSNNRTFVENGGLRWTETVKDSFNRTHRLVLPRGDAGSPTGPTERQYGFEANPLVETVIDPTGRTKRTYRDLWNNITRVDEIINGQTHTTRYEYDHFNKLNVIHLSDGSDIHFNYDTAGRRREVQDPNMGRIVYRYDIMDNPLEVEDAKGNVLKSVYDNYNRLTEQYARLPNGIEEGRTRYFYDAADRGNFEIRKGELFRAEDTAGSVRFSYDRFGNSNKVARQIQGLEGEWTTEYSFGNDSRMRSILFPSGKLNLRYFYDRSGKIERIQNAMNAEIYYQVNSNNGYDDNGNLLQEALGNETENQSLYYANSHRLLENTTRYKGVPNATYRRLRYEYDAYGNVAGVRDMQNPPKLNSGLIGIQYDDLHRLLSYGKSNDWESRDRTEYRYDPLGNLLRNDESFAGAEYEYGGVQQVTQIGALEFQYDPNGSMTSGRGREFSYNGRNQLKEVRLQNGERMEYLYDYNGRRLVKTIHRPGAAPEKRYFLGPHFEIQNNLWIHHIYAGGKRIAVWAAEKTEREEPAANAGGYVFRVDVEDDWPKMSENYFYYVHRDHLGSSNLFTEGAARSTHGGLRYKEGDLVQRIEHTPFGRERLVLNPSLDEIPRFTGQVYDIETDLYYYNSRYYDPVLARFIQPDSIIPDPYDSQSLNPYSYVLNNPLRYVDPTGHIMTVPAGLGLSLDSDYLEKSGEQVLFGNYSEETTALGLAAQIGLGLTGLDILGDVRDLVYDVQHFEFSGESIVRSLLDAVGLAPVIGVLKYTDETASTVSKAYHYTTNEAAELISGTGLKPSFLTPRGDLSPIQAHLDLALDPTKGPRNALFEIDVSGAKEAGVHFSPTQQISRSHNMPGGEMEFQNLDRINKEFLRRIR